MANDDATTTTGPVMGADSGRIGPDVPLAIEALGLEKSFRIPTHRVDSLKERVVRPFAARDHRLLHALDGVSFEIRQGEFFGIVGRNGSGKSTLLKCLASIYRPDAGTIRMAGRLAPFIELGVGFNVELTARENVVLNGVMMGLTRAETRRRLGSVVEFAELEEFVDLKLKNYSSGMLVRLAFSLMMHVDADVLLIDEVLAVGDAAFQQKCADAFHEMKSKGKTIVLVTHSMATVSTYCDRAMLIDEGAIRMIGDPDEIGRQYLRLNFERDSGAGGETAARESAEARLLDIWVENASGVRGGPVEQGEAIVVGAELEVLGDLTEVGIGFLLTNADGIGLFQFGTNVDGDGDSNLVRAGRRVRVGVRMENPLVSGRYFLHFGVSRGRGAGTALYVHNAADFVVFGGESPGGMVMLDHEIDAVVEEGEES
jgi:ABC-type polysaccharide/polyol phosphate transport system ATPase subunit